jgi:hypothetical protein
MGVYRTLFANLKCQRCGSMFRTDIQFKTGDDYQMQAYEEEQPVAAEDDLQPGSYEGCSDRFCDPCLELWQEHEADAFINALVQLVEGGDLTVTRSAALLKAPTVREVLETDKELGIMSPGARLSRFDLVLAWKGQQVHPRSQIPPWESEFWTVLNNAMNKELLRNEWELGCDVFREDLEVVVHEDRAISVELSR